MFQRKAISGWGRFPFETCAVYRPERQTEVLSILASGAQSGYISRGLGRSYGDAALNRDSGVISHVRLNRFLSFDESTGVLECEGGASLDEILKVFLPRGFFPLVTPGTRFVTVGGAIANDVHGKNHHADGTFATSLLDFTLATATGEVLVCSRDRNPEIFWATVGGLGLTGAILSARVQLQAVESAYVQVSHHRTRNLDETLQGFADSDDRYRYSVAWIDCLAGGNALGRSVLMLGNHAEATALPPSVGQPLEPPSRAMRSIPFDLPSSTLNRRSVALFNSVYYRVHADAANRLVDFERFFYPLDAIRNWNRMYGHRGFVQYQVALPDEGGVDGLRLLLERLARSGRASFLAVLKRFGAANPGLLSFPFQGYTLALDLPAAPGIREFLHQLDEVVLRHRGRVYLGKDAVLTPESFARMYPRAEEFRRVKRIVDPRGLLASSLSHRVGLTEP